MPQPIPLQARQGPIDDATNLKSAILEMVIMGKHLLQSLSLLYKHLFSVATCILDTWIVDMWIVCN